MEPQAVVIDTDCGVDDALALMTVLSMKDVEIVAITCVAGNTSLHNVRTNVARVLHVCGYGSSNQGRGRAAPPVYCGCEESLCRGNTFASYYHGRDGLGDVPVDECESTGYDTPQPASALPILEHAAVKLVELARQRPGELSVIVLGPCTNVALAHRLAPATFTPNLRRIVCMGGNVHGRGNVSAGAEFNFAADPEAARVVVEQARCPVTLVPWEALTANPISMDAFAALVDRPTRRARFVRAITAVTLRFADNQLEQVADPADTANEQLASDDEGSLCRRPGYVVGDALAVLAALRPHTVTQRVKRRVAVEVDGEHTAGQLVQAWFKQMLPHIERTTDIVLRFDRGAVESILLEMVNDS